MLILCKMCSVFNSGWWAHQMNKYVLSECCANCASLCSFLANCVLCYFVQNVLLSVHWIVFNSGWWARQMNKWPTLSNTVGVSLCQKVQSVSWDVSIIIFIGTKVVCVFLGTVISIIATVSYVLIAYQMNQTQLELVFAKRSS